MRIENKSSSYPETETRKRELYAPYNQLAVSTHSKPKLNKKHLFKQEMNNKFLTFLKNLTNVIKYIFVGIWGLLTVVVIIFLIHRFLNPGWKSISNLDLKNYGKISLLFLPIIGMLQYLRILIIRKLN